MLKRGGGWSRSPTILLLELSECRYNMQMEPSHQAGPVAYPLKLSRRSDKVEPATAPMMESMEDKCTASAIGDGAGGIEMTHSEMRRAGQRLSGGSQGIQQRTRWGI